MKFEIVVLKNLKEITRIKGEKTVRYKDLTAEDLKQIIHIEALLEKLTGFRFHINQIVLK